MSSLLQFFHFLVIAALVVLFIITDVVLVKDRERRNGAMAVVTLQLPIIALVTWAIVR